MRLGLAGAIVPSDPQQITPSWARRIASRGVSALVTHLRPPPEELVGNPSLRIRDVLGDAGIRIVQAAGFNPDLVHPDEAFRLAEIERLRGCFEVSCDLGAEMLITGCGSLHPEHHYGPDARNHHPQTHERLVDSLVRVAPLAEENDVIFALECHVMTTLSTPAAIKEILDAVDSPWIRANFDPVNMLGSLPEMYDNASVMERMWEVVGGHYACSAHIKDVVARAEFVLHIDEVAPGKGLLDLPTFFAVCQRLGDNPAVIVEHLPVDEVAQALEVVRDAATRAGVNFVT